MSKASSSQGRSPRLEDLVGGLRTVRRLNASDPVVTSLTQDSREVGPGTVFVAVRGEKADGHRFIAGAVEAGAAAIVCEEMPTPLPDCPVIVWRTRGWPSARWRTSTSAARRAGCA